VKHLKALACIVALLSAPAAAQEVSSTAGNPIQLQSTTVTLDATGDATWTYDTPFPVAPDLSHMVQGLDKINPVTCNYMARTNALVTIHCWRANTLSALLGGMFSGSVAGVQVNLTARYRQGQ